MKSRLGSAIVALGAFAGISVLSASASAQNMDQGPGAQPPGTLQAPVGPTIGSQPLQTVGETKTEFLRPNPVLITTGGVTILASYIPSLVVAASSDHDGDKWLYAPLFGPWVDLATRGCGDAPPTGTCGISGFDRAALIGNGIVQAAGLAQILWAFTLPQRQLVVTAQADKPTLHIAPGTVGHANGIVAFGTF
jgi:hypothetical protein